jgi:hypothetical protein
VHRLFGHIGLNPLRTPVTEHPTGSVGRWTFARWCYPVVRHLAYRLATLAQPAVDRLTAGAHTSERVAVVAAKWVGIYLPHVPWSLFGRWPHLRHE